MNNAWLEALEPKPGCLSDLEIAERTHDARLDRSHIATCEACAARMREQQAAHDAAAYEPVPAALTAPLAREDKGRAPSWRPRLVWGGLVSFAVTAVLAAVLVVPGLVKEPEEATISTQISTQTWTQKGSVGIYATVMRGESLLEDDTLLSAVAPLHPADRVRLRVSGGVATVTVSSWEQETWQELYKGPVDDDGWLPGSVTITDSGATRLRVVVCPQANAPTRCNERTFNL